jgi:hypothetical protein
MKVNEWTTPTNLIAIFGIAVAAFSVMCLPDSSISIGVSKMIFALKIVIWGLYIATVIYLWTCTFKAKREKIQFQKDRDENYNELVEYKKAHDKVLETAVKENDRLSKTNALLNQTMIDHSKLFDRLEGLCNTYFDLLNQNDKRVIEQASEAYSRYKKEERDIYGDKPFLQLNHYFNQE